MSTDTEPTAAEQAPRRPFRRATPPSKSRTAPSVEPPRKRRPALAALAVLLIVGGALAAGLLAVRMDSREPVLAAARDIAPGTLITQEDLREVPVASEGLQLIPTELAAEVLDGGTYSLVPIRADSLIDQNMLTKEPPVGDDRAIVAVPLNAALTPARELRDGDLVSVVRVGGEGAQAEPTVVTEALVLSVSQASADDLGGETLGSISLLVPDEVAYLVVDAAGSDLAGIALLERGVSSDSVELRVGE